LIHEDSLRCPACGEYITISGGIVRHSIWWWTTWILLAIIVVFWLFWR
jgi:hypothetical protein